jgi:hypothetical protein
VPPDSTQYEFKASRSWSRSALLPLLALTLVDPVKAAIEENCLTDKATGECVPDAVKKPPPPSVEIKSNPEGASVIEGGQPIGVTPFRLKGPAPHGKAYILTIRKDGFEDETLTVKLTKPNERVSVQLRPLPKVTFHAKDEPGCATPLPADIRITIDGKETVFGATATDALSVIRNFGRNPYTLSLPRGNHAFGASAPGHVAWSREYDIQAADQIPICLMPLPATLVVGKGTRLRGLRLEVDGRRRGELPQTLGVEAGVHEIAVSTKNYREAKLVELKPGEHLNIEVGFPKADQSVLEPFSSVAAQYACKGGDIARLTSAFAEEPVNQSTQRERIRACYLLGYAHHHKIGFTKPSDEEAVRYYTRACSALGPPGDRNVEPEAIAACLGLLHLERQPTRDEDVADALADARKTLEPLRRPERWCVQPRVGSKAEAQRRESVTAFALLGAQSSLAIDEPGELSQALCLYKTTAAADDLTPTPYAGSQKVPFFALGLHVLSGGMVREEVPFYLEVGLTFEFFLPQCLGCFRGYVGPALRLRSMNVHNITRSETYYKAFPGYGIDHGFMLAQPGGSPYLRAEFRYSGYVNDHISSFGFLGAVGMVFGQSTRLEVGVLTETMPLQQLTVDRFGTDITLSDREWTWIGVARLGVMRVP